MRSTKIAIILVGNMRSFSVTFKRLDEYFMQHYQCDVYITTYDKRFNTKGGGGYKEEIVTEESVKNIYGKYLKHLVILNQDTFSEHYNRLAGKHYTFDGDLDRLYTIHKITTLAYDIFRGECVKNNRTYDIIMKVRPDFLITDILNINPSLTDNQIIVPSNNSGGSFNDHFAYGKPKAMEKYLTYYRTFHEIDRLDDGKACDVSIVEDGLRKHLDVNKIEIIRTPVNYMLLRDIKPQKIMFAGKGQFFVKKYN